MFILKSCCILISNLKGYIVEELFAVKIWSFCQIVNSSFWYLFVAFHWFLTQSLEPTIRDKCDINFYVLLSALPYDRLLQLQPFSADVSDHEDHSIFGHVVHGFENPWGKDLCSRFKFKVSHLHMPAQVVNHRLDIWASWDSFSVFQDRLFLLLISLCWQNLWAPIGESLFRFQQVSRSSFPPQFFPPRTLSWKGFSQYDHGFQMKWSQNIN